MRERIAPDKSATLMAADVLPHSKSKGKTVSLPSSGNTSNSYTWVTLVSFGSRGLEPCLSFQDLELRVRNLTMPLDDGSSPVGMPEFVVVRAAFVDETVSFEESYDLSSFDHPIPDPVYCQ